MLIQQYHRAYDLLKTMARDADAARKPAVRAELDAAMVHLMNAWNLMKPPPPANR